MLDDMLKNSREQININKPIDKSTKANDMKTNQAIDNTEQHLSTNVNNDKQIIKKESNESEKVDTSQHKSTNVNKLIDEIINNTNTVLPKDVHRKTFYLKPKTLKMFKYIKRKKRIGESEFINYALEKIFNEEFGSNWQSLAK
jgi:uncharacterized membrane-anchored protein YjiN (DUF445 family)